MVLLSPEVHIQNPMPLQNNKFSTVDDACFLVNVAESLQVTQLHGKSCITKNQGELKHKVGEMGCKGVEE